jgi:hypothetical protein
VAAFGKGLDVFPMAAHGRIKTVMLTKCRKRMAFVYSERKVLSEIQIAKQLTLRQSLFKAAPRP